MTEPWKNEPRSLDFEHAGLKCAMRRGPRELGHWCGYVRVEEGHPCFGMDYPDLAWDIDVHGGITYSADHEPSGEPDGGWWFGFDCAHYGDLIPGIDGGVSSDGRYRDQAYVKAECCKLADQLACVVREGVAG